MSNHHRPMMQIKGIKEGLMVTLGEGEWIDLENALMEHIEEKETFFKGARMALDVGNHILRAAEMGALRDRLSNKGIGLWAVISNSPLTEQTALMLGMATRISTPRPERAIRPLDTNLEGESAIFVQRTLRSGFKVSHTGHVIVLGDINPGAEVVANGSIIIWGKLRVVVHAGVEGNENAVVCALDMMPTQLRIGSYVSIPSQRKGKHEPELARIHNGQVIVESWNPRK